MSGRAKAEKQGDKVWFSEIFLPLHRHIASIIGDFHEKPFPNKEVQNKLNPLWERLRDIPQPISPKVCKLEKAYERELEKYIMSYMRAQEYWDDLQRRISSLQFPASMWLTSRKLGSTLARGQTSRYRAEDRMNRVIEGLKALLEK